MIRLLWNIQLVSNIQTVKWHAFMVILSFFWSMYSDILAVLTKTRDDLKPPDITWNQLEPPGTTQKLPEISHIIIFFLLKISYSRVAFVLILHLKVFFGQIWSQNLKFSKLTKGHRGTLLYLHFQFNVYFSKIFVTHNFLDKFGLIIWISSNWLKFRRGVHYYMLFTVLIFIFSEFFLVNINKTSVNIKNNKFWDKIFHKILWIANTLKNYESKPQSPCNNVPLYQISVNMEKTKFCFCLPKIIWMTNKILKN